ncbi:nucleotidyltransferase family protein [Planctomycetota bacterium]
MGESVDLRSRLRAALEAEESVAWAYLFGSAARGGPFRDVDVALMILCDDQRSLVSWGRLRERVSERLGHPVDLVDLRAAPLTVAGPLLPEALLLVDRAPERRCGWEAETTSRWLDFRPLHLRYSQLRREALGARLRRQS